MQDETKAALRNLAGIIADETAKDIPNLDYLRGMADALVFTLAGIRTVTPPVRVLKVPLPKAPEFTAKDERTCGRCGQPILVGEAISWNRNKRGEYWHRTCQDERPEEATERRKWFDMEDTPEAEGARARVKSAALEALQEALEAD